MEIFQKLLGYMLLAALVVGVALGVWYDALRLSRMLIGLDLSMMKPGDGRAIDRLRRLPACLLLLVEDLIFGLSCGLALILLLYYTNDGRFRLMAVAGMIGGYTLHRVTLGRLFDLCAPRVVRFLHRLVKKLLWLLFLPWRGLARLWQCTVGANIRRAVDRRREKRAVHYSEQVNEAYIREAARGFDLWHEDEKNS